MSTNIDDLDIQQLQALKKEADALIEKKRRERIAEAYQQLVEIAKTVGLTLNELLEYGRSKGTKSVAKRGAVAPSCRQPAWASSSCSTCPRSSPRCSPNG